MNSESEYNLEPVSKQIHNMWMTWAKILLKTEPNISEKRKKRWQEECFKPYEELSEKMKQLDRNFAIQILETIK